MTSWFTDQTLSWVTKPLSSVPLCHKLWQKVTNQPSANEMEQWMKRKWNVLLLIPVYIPSALALRGQLLLSKTIHLEEEKRERKKKNNPKCIAQAHGWMRSFPSKYDTLLRATHLVWDWDARVKFFTPRVHPVILGREVILERKDSWPTGGSCSLPKRSKDTLKKEKGRKKRPGQSPS